MTEINSEKKQAYTPPYFRGVEYVISVPSPDSSELESKPSVAFTGRSNSGKSSLISALCDHKNLARSSKTAGKTRMLNYFIIPAPGENDSSAYLIDMPGYGYAKLSGSEREALSEMIESFFLKASGLCLVIVVLDARRNIGQDERSILQYCATEGIRVLFARTKWDTLNATEKKKARKDWQTDGILDLCLPVSSTKKKGLEPILESIRKAIASAGKNASMDERSHA